MKLVSTINLLVVREDGSQFQVARTDSGDLGGNPRFLESAATQQLDAQTYDLLPGLLRAGGVDEDRLPDAMVLGAIHDEARARAAAARARTSPDAASEALRAAASAAEALGSERRAVVRERQKLEDRLARDSKWATTPGVNTIRKERQRQIEAKHHTPQEDEGRGGELMQAASSYLQAANLYHLNSEGWATMPTQWPWPERYWSPGPVDEMLAKAGALIAAALDSGTKW